MLLNVLKLGCLVLYALAIAALAGLLPPALGGAVQIMAILFLVVHAFELLFAFRFLPLWRGPMAAGVALAMLFGILHWGPLARQARRGAR